MKKKYVIPLIEILDIEIEDAILQTSGDEDYIVDPLLDGGSAW